MNPLRLQLTVTTSREALGQLLAAAMLNGYFLRRAEERMGWEKQLAYVGEEQ